MQKTVCSVNEHFSITGELSESTNPEAHLSIDSRHSLVCAQIWGKAMPELKAA